MGMAKRILEEQWEMRALALQVLCDAGVLQECEYHAGYFFEGSSDVEDAYRLANARITRGEIELPNGYTRRDFTDHIKRAHEEFWANDGCTYCEHIMSKD